MSKFYFFKLNCYKVLEVLKTTPYDTKKRHGIMKSIDTKQWRIFKSYNTLYHIKNVNNTKEMKEEENEHRRIWINNIDKCLAKRVLRTKISWHRGRRWKKMKWIFKARINHANNTKNWKKEDEKRKKERKRKKVIWNKLHSERRAGMFLVICTLDFLMKLTLCWKEQIFICGLPC